MRPVGVWCRWDGEWRRACVWGSRRASSICRREHSSIDPKRTFSSLPGSLFDQWQPGRTAFGAGQARHRFASVSACAIGRCRRTFFALHPRQRADNQHSGKPPDEARRRRPIRRGRAGARFRTCEPRRTGRTDRAGAAAQFRADPW